jgi:hypothetical protein
MEEVPKEIFHEMCFQMFIVDAAHIAVASKSLYEKMSEHLAYRQQELRKFTTYVMANYEHCNEMTLVVGEPITCGGSGPYDDVPIMDYLLHNLVGNNFDELNDLHQISKIFGRSNLLISNHVANRVLIEECGCLLDDFSEVIAVVKQVFGEFTIMNNMVNPTMWLDWMGHDLENIKLAASIGLDLHIEDDENDVCGTILDYYLGVAIGGTNHRDIIEYLVSQGVSCNYEYAVYKYYDGDHAAANNEHVALLCSMYQFKDKLLSNGEYLRETELGQEILKYQRL